MSTKTAILVGKFNDITKEVNEHLSTFCNVQLASESKDVFAGILHMSKPDIVIFLLTGISAYPTDMVGLVVRENPYTPMVIVGNGADEKDLKDKHFLDRDWVTFLKRPVKTEKIGEETKKLLEKDMPKEPPKPEKPTILLVDDSQALLRYMHALLSKKYKVNFATSGFQAITSISKSVPDIILLDYEMPVMDGKQTLQMLRSEDSTKDIPVIFLTGTSDSARVIDAMEYRPEGYLLKPCSEEKLFATIDFVLKETKEHKEKKEKKTEE